MAIRVLIVDDSLFFRKRLTEIISSDPQLEVISVASNGQQALDLTKTLRPDVITMDIEMPVMDGITATRKIMSQAPTPILMLSTWSTEGAQSTLDALDAGAADFLPKRFEEISKDHAVAKQELCQRIRNLATNYQIVKKSASIDSSATQPSSNLSMLQLVAIGTSTGGPVALQKVLSQLPSSFPYPIVIVQHMPASFTPSFAERLNAQCNIRIKHAETGDKLTAGTAYLAPGGQQMLITGREHNLRIRIKESEENQTYKPCIDITFESIAKICASSTLAIILTGMGSDGQKGCQSLHQSGGAVWSQDKKSSTIYGMPLAIVKAGLADKVLSLLDIGHHLAEMD